MGLCVNDMGNLSVIGLLIMQLSNITVRAAVSAESLNRLLILHVTSCLGFVASWLLLKPVFFCILAVECKVACHLCKEIPAHEDAESVGEEQNFGSFLLSVLVLINHV